MHAAMEAARSFIPPHTEHPSVIFCGIASEQELLREYLRLRALGIRLKSFIEPDIGYQFTAFASEPVHGARRDYFANFKTIRSLSESRPRQRVIGGVR